MSVPVSTFLRRALAIDAVASAGTALLSIVAAATLSRLFEVPEALLRNTADRQRAHSPRYSPPARR